MKHNFYIQSDAYFNDPDRASDMEEMGIDCSPVDIFGGFVPTSKEAKDNIATTQEIIRRRFSLGR